MSDTLVGGMIPTRRDVEDWMRGHTLDDLPEVSPTPLAAFKWLTDEWAMQIELAQGRTRIPDGSFRRRLRSELTEARELFEQRGWLADPRSYHRDPDTAIRPLSITAAAAGPFGYEHVRYESTFSNWPDEPGSDRWAEYRPVRTGHAWMMCHEGAPRPWMVLVNGYRTGEPALDLGSFRANHLHHELGLNVIAVVLPLHGPRAIGASGSRVIHAGAMNTVFTMAQGAWDVRSVIRWLREEHDAPAVGLTGISLGGYMVSLLSGLEDDLACVIAGVPESDLVRGIRRQMEPLLPPFYEQWGLSWEPLRQVLSVCSPLSFECRVPHDRRFIYAGLLDRWVRPGNVHTLWQHWDEPSIHWYEGSHLSFPFERSVHAYVDDALHTSFDL